MGRNLLSAVGQSGVDNLTGDNYLPQKRIQVLLPAGGPYHRGQLLVLDDGIDDAMLASENLVGIEAAIPTAAAEKVDCVLLDEIGDDETTGVTRAAAALTGEFNLNCVLWGAIPAIDQPAMIRAAWDKQLHLAPLNQAPYVQFGEV